MALSYTDSVGVSYDADQGFFDGPEIITIDLVGEAIDSAEAFGTIRLNHRLAFTGISSSEAFGTLSANHGLVAFEGIPGASGNKLLRSAEFDNSAWGKSGVTVVANSILSPDGEMTADEIIENTSNSNHGVSQGQFRLNVGAPHICSVRAKLGVGSRLLKFNGFGNGGNGVTFNLLTGATQSNASWGALSATDLGDDWWLCSGILNPNDNVNGLVISLSETAGGVNYIGDGVSSIYLEGAMFVEGSIETPYIATFGLPAQ